ncbi:type VI secretion system baseplate subunit TssF [Poseidonocella sp. HB161398]|uniref:type VI secretion system baseplate subunit TssF n=1 Tax=Poseidonocella sp. HB161398 TaxID=2320855 RepID=UPI001107EFEC|nr:type VI secretion system baseplate subunit TssF [Poseidonocella sp. HB161398]
MTPDFLRLYNEELGYMREMGAEFAAAYPKIAGRLGLEAAPAADPNVERLLEGVAFLAARVQAKLQARFPDFTQHLLEIVYPHFLAPVPSMAIVGFRPDPDAGRMQAGHLVPRGARLTSAVLPGTITACEFRTARDVRLWPLEIRAAEYVDAPARLAALELPAGRRAAAAAIRLRLGTTNGLPLQALGLGSLDLHFPAAGGTGGALLRQLLADCTGILLRPLERPCPWQERLPASALRHCFDDPAEALLPVVPRAFDGYRLLQEYFALPERTLFAELSGIGDAVRACEAEEMEIVFALGRACPRLQRGLRRESFCLFATPAANLFERRADRIQLDDARHDYHVVPDRVRPLDLEVHSVCSVEGETASGGSQAFRPFYSLAGDGQAAAGGYYTLRRAPRVLSQAARRAGGRTGHAGSEAYLAIADPACPPYDPELRQLSVACRCTNRDLPLLMPTGIGETDFTLETGAPVAAIRCLAPPTAPLASAAEGDTAWKLISHLSLNYLSIADTGGGSGAAALRELLSLYAGPGRADLARQAAGIETVSCAPVVRRLGGAGQSAVARGTEIALCLDEAAFEGIGIYPLAAVLARFLARHASLNSFAETVLCTRTEGEVARWTAQPGRRATL